MLPYITRLKYPQKMNSFSADGIIDRLTQATKTKHVEQRLRTWRRKQKIQKFSRYFYFSLSAPINDRS